MLTLQVLKDRPALRRREPEPVSGLADVNPNRTTGTVGFGSAEGTLEMNYADLTDDDQAQLCTTGVVIGRLIGANRIRHLSPACPP